MTEESTERTTVVNLKNDDYEVFIGRPSLWGNPFRIGRDGSREEVIAKFRHYIKNTCPHLIDMAREQLKGRVLGCYCKPLPCHGDVWVELIEESKGK